MWVWLIMYVKGTYNVSYYVHMALKSVSYKTNIKLIWSITSWYVSGGQAADPLEIWFDAVGSRTIIYLL